MTIETVNSKAAKKNKDVSALLKQLESIAASGTKIKVDDVYSDDKREMLLNILNALNLGISESKIEEILSLSR